MKQNELMHSCLATLQTTNRVLQKCHGALLDVLNDAESQKSFLESSCTLMTSTLKILRIGMLHVHVVLSQCLEWNVLNNMPVVVLLLSFVTC